MMYSVKLRNTYLDKRGRCHNLRVRGLPESIEPSSLTPTVSAVFNDLLERPHDTPIEMERIHRALRPRGKDTDLPRDVVCCLVNYPLKDKILRKACNRNHLLHQGAEIKIFQDISNITLQCKRKLRPLLDLLRARAITYRQTFPFCLFATSQELRGTAAPQPRRLTEEPAFPLKVVPAYPTQGQYTTLVDYLNISESMFGALSPHAHIILPP